MRNSHVQSASVFKDLPVLVEFEGFDYASYKAFIQDEITDLNDLLLLIKEEEYRILLEKKLDNKYTVNQILDTIRNMNLTLKDDDYIPHYIRTDLTDDLHKKFRFRTDYEIITEKNLKKICKQTKN